MKNFIQTLWAQTQEFFKKLERGQWIRLGILVVLLLAVVIGAAIVLTRVEYSPLYTGMSQTEAGEVFAMLQSQGVPVRTVTTGNTVTLSVPSNQADTLRLQLAAQGYPKDGLSYDLFTKGAGFGATDAEKQQWATYNLEANLRAAIMSMPQVNNAVVFLSIPRESVFVLDVNQKPSTASVMVDLKDGQRLNDDQVRAIAQLVANASGLQPEAVSITDFNMNVYALKDPNDQTLSSENALEQMQIQSSVRKDLENQLLTLLSPIFGADKIRVSVGVVLNFDKHNIESVKFEPPVPEAGNNGIVISMKELSETIRAQEVAQGAVGTDPNGIAPEYPAAEITDNTPYERLEREMNMEVNEIRETITKAQAGIEKLSVSVVLDSQAEVQEQVTSLVSNAIGVPQENISVENMAFASASNELLDAMKLREDSARMMVLSRALPLVIVAIVVLVIAAMIAKLIREAVRSKSIEVSPEFQQEMDELRETLRQLTGGYDTGYEDGDALLLDMANMDADEPVPDLSVNRNKKRRSLEQMIDKNPEEVTQLLRNWLDSE